MTTSGAEAQALCCMMIIMLSMVNHLMMRPFEKVTEEHHTLFWSEFYGLLVAFLTFWTGLFFYQEVAQEKSLQIMFTAELLFVNVIFLVFGLRCFFILKLMDLTDLIDTKRLQGYEDIDLESERLFASCLTRCVPEWGMKQNLWARRAWQRTVRENILKRRVVNIGTRKDNRFTLGNTMSLHDDAHRSLGLRVLKSVKLEKKSKLSKLSKTNMKRRKSRRLHQHTTAHNIGVLKASIKWKAKLQSLRDYRKRRGSRQSGTFKASLLMKQIAFRSKQRVLAVNAKHADSLIVDHVESLNVAKDIIEQNHL